MPLNWAMSGFMPSYQPALPCSPLELKNTPEPVIAKLNAALKTALASPNLQDRFKTLSSVVPTAEEVTPAFVAKMVPAEIEKYRLLLQDK